MTEMYLFLSPPLHAPEDEEGTSGSWSTSMLMASRSLWFQMVSVVAVIAVEARRCLFFRTKIFGCVATLSIIFNSILSHFEDYITGSSGSHWSTMCMQYLSILVLQYINIHQYNVPYLHLNSSILFSFCIYSKLHPLYLPVPGHWSSGHCIPYREYSRLFECVSTHVLFLLASNIYFKLLPLFLPVSGLWSCGHCISYRVAMFIKIYSNTCPFFFVPSVYTLNFSPCSFQSLGFGFVVTVFLIKWQCLLRYM